MRKHPRVALALQGGGAHGAFSAGVLDRLLEKGLAPDRISGVSSGALIGTMLAQGWAAGGPEGAREAVKRLWQRVAEAHAASGIKNGPLERWLWGADLSNNPLWQGVETAIRLFSPEQLNPLGHNPLRSLVAELLDRDLLASPAAPRLSVGATDVETGAPVLFRNQDITVEVLLASACLPSLFPPVEIEGRLLWDGAYSANPPLTPLLQPDLPDELVLIRAQPRRRPGRPGTQAEIFNRQNEIAFQRALELELAMLPRSIRLTNYEPDEALAALPISSKLHAEENVLRALFTAGRETVRRAEARAPGTTAVSTPRLPAFPRPGKAIAALLPGSTEARVGLSFWLQLAVTGIIGVLALIKASASQGDASSTIAFLIFLAAIAYGFWLVKSAFDRIDRSGH